MRRNELDEMQMQKRNKVGNQAFMLLFYLLMIDIGAYGFGFRWLQYPTDVFVIMLVCMSYYLIRIIWNNAYIGPETKSRPAGRKAVYITAVAGFAAAVSIFLATRNFAEPQVSNPDDNGAMILFIISAVSLLIALIVGIIAKRQNGDGDE